MRIVTYCDRCKEPAKVSNKIIKGQTVLRCLKCDHFWFDGDHFRAVGASDQVRHQLQGRLEELQREYEAMHGADDPRWTVFRF
jgi:hypothetical protein